MLTMASCAAGFNATFSERYDVFTDIALLVRKHQF